MFTVIRVYDNKSNDMVAVVTEDQVVAQYHGISEFTVASIMVTAGADAVVGSALDRKMFDAAYPINLHLV